MELLCDKIFNLEVLFSFQENIVQPRGESNQPAIELVRVRTKETIRWK